jgi:hypothetical protein
MTRTAVSIEMGPSITLRTIVAPTAMRRSGVQTCAAPMVLRVGGSVAVDGVFGFARRRSLCEHAFRCPTAQEEPWSKRPVT